MSTTEKEYLAFWRGFNLCVNLVNDELDRATFNFKATDDVDAILDQVKTVLNREINKIKKGD